MSWFTFKPKKVSLTAHEIKFITEEIYKMKLGKIDDILWRYKHAEIFDSREPLIIEALNTIHKIVDEQIESETQARESEIQEIAKTVFKKLKQ